MTQKPLALIAGAGPGLGTALMQRCADGGYHVIGLCRTLNDDARFEQHQLDLSDANAVDQTIAGIIKNHNAPKLVVHNTSALVIKPFLETSIDDFEQCWGSIVKSAILVAQAVLGPMQTSGGSFIVSGATASQRGGAKFAAFASAKFALRGLTQSLAREFQPKGIHVAHVILDGLIDTARSRSLHVASPDTMMKTSDIAEAFWQCAHQPASTWTHELDLRPASERF